MSISSILFQSNNSNKDGGHQKADLMAMIEAAKSKIHQVWTLWFNTSLKLVSDTPIGLEMTSDTHFPF